MKKKKRANKCDELNVTVEKKTDAIRCYSGQMLYSGYAASIIGTRKEQQDSFAIVTFHANHSAGANSLLAVVCDGIGGFTAGKEASETAVAAVIEAFQETTRPLESFSDTFERAAISADKKVISLSNKVGNHTGTTLVAVYLESDCLFWGNVGDSRLYLYREGKITCLTRDHNYGLELQDMVRTKQISQEDADSNSEKEALISFIGMNDPAYIDTSECGIPLTEGDLLLLCSDGLYKSLTVEEIEGVLLQYTSMPSFIPGVLTASAFDKDYPHQDNTTVVVITCQSGR